MFKKILFFVLTSLLFLSPLVVVGDNQVRQLETVYPDIPGVKTIEEDATLPEYLEYIYYFIISLTGIAALIILIWGGLIYLTSAGSPNKMKEGINRIIGGLSGVAIVLFAHLILTTINPDIFGLVTQEITLPAEGYCLRGDQVYWRKECPQKWNSISATTCNQVIGPTPYTNYECCKAERIYCFDQSINDLTKIGFIPKEINFRSEEPRIDSVFVFEKPDYQGKRGSIFNTKRQLNNDTWWSFKHLGIQFISSVYPVGRNPGFVIFPTQNCLYDFSDFSKNMPTMTYSRPTPRFDKEAVSILRVPRGEDEDWYNYVSWGGVFFSSEEYHGECQIIFHEKLHTPPGQNQNCFHPDENYPDAQIGSRNQVQSAYIFRRNIANDFSGQVTFCPLLNYEPIEDPINPVECHTVQASDIISRNTIDSIWRINNPLGRSDWAGGRQENILSVKVDGKFLVVLNSEPDFRGNCTVIDRDTPNLIGSHVIGDNDREIRSIAIIPLQ